MDNAYKLNKMHYSTGDNGLEAPVVMSFVFLNVGLGFFQIFIGIIGTVVMLFRFLTQVKDAGGFTNYFIVWRDLLKLFVPQRIQNLFKPNDKDVQGPD